VRDISVIIPARNEHPAATFTLQRIWDELEGSGFDWETILVDNLSEDRTSKFLVNRQWHKTGRLKILEYKERGSCWGARNAGLSVAEGRIVFLFDAHVLVSDSLFSRQMDTFIRYPSATILYTPVIWMADTRRHTAYGYNLGTDNGHMRTKFWGSWTKKKRSDDPYRIPMSGTAGIAIRRDFLEFCGGWPKTMSVYGGGEQWISLLCWMTGGECWIDPQTYLYHLADRRNYSHDGNGKSTNDGHFYNKCLVGYALGGEPWWTHLRDWMISPENPHAWKKPYHEAAKKIAAEARKDGEPYREWVERHADFTLDEILALEPWK
jgi:glycosyltransferase involved in cell wall biosynthesis